MDKLSPEFKISLTLNRPRRKRIMAENRETVRIELDIEELESKIAPDDSVSVPIIE